MTHNYLPWSDNNIYIIIIFRGAKYIALLNILSAAIKTALLERISIHHTQFGLHV